MLVKLALSGHASPEALSKFERIKAYVPDSAPVLVTYFNKQVLLSDEFKDLWDRIKYQTTYRVDFNENDLVNECAKNINYEVSVGKIKYVYSKALNKITKVGVEIDEETLIKDKHIDSEIIDYKLPDIVTYIQNETNLTRRNIVDILIKSEKLNDFKNNPQKFIDKVIEIIKKTMNSFIVDGIKYQKLGNDYYYTQESFENEELTGYLKKNMYENKNKLVSSKTAGISDINYFRRVNHSNIVTNSKPKSNWDSLLNDFECIINS